MPTNFNQALDTVTPNVPTYTPESGGGMLSGTAEIFSDIAGEIKAYGERKSEARKQTTLAGLTMDVLDERDKAVKELTALQQQEDKALSSVNPEDAETLKRATRERDRINARRKQLGMENTTATTAVLRRYIAANPHLTDELLATFKSSELAWSQTFEDQDKIGKADETLNAARLDAVVKKAADMNVDISVATAALATEARVADTEGKSKLRQLDGSSVSGDGITLLGDFTSAGMAKVSLAAGKLTTTEGANLFSSKINNEFQDRFNAWRKEQIKNGAEFTPAIEEQFRTTMNTMRKAIQDHAQAIASDATYRREAQKNVKFSTMVGGALYGNSPVWRKYLAERPDVAAQVVLSTMKGLETVRVEGLANVEKRANAGDPEARLTMMHVRNYVKLEAANATMSPDNDSAELIETTAKIIDAMDRGQSIVDLAKPGTLNEILGLTALQDSDTPASLAALSEKAEKDASALLNGESVGNIDTVARLTDFAPYRKALTQNLEARATVVNNLQNSIINTLTNKPEITVDYDTGLSSSWNDKTKLTFKGNLLNDPTVRAGASSFVAISETKDAQLLNSSIRALKYYMKPAEYKEWFSRTFGQQQQ